MKKLFFATCMLLMTISASAQVTWNSKLGLGFSSCTTSESDWEMKSHFVGKLGVGIEYPVSPNLSIMPSLEFAMKGAKGGSDEELSSTYIQVPVMAAYRLNLNKDWNITLKVGPYFAYALSGKYKFGGYDFDIFSESDMGGSEYTGDRFDAGIDVGLDFEYHRYVFGVEYEHGFINFFPKMTGIPKVYNQAFYATVGYKF